MDFLKVLKALSVGLSCMGLILPASLPAAPAPARTTGNQPVTGEAEPIGDVELNADGYLQGIVLDVDGMPVARSPVVIRRLSREVARAETNASGQFSVGPLRGGTYQLNVGVHGRLVRVWAADTAPPVAKKITLVVVGGQVVRAQTPPCCYCTEPVLLGFAAAMIAVPVAVHNSKSAPHTVP